MRHGLAAALASLICSLQPLVTAALAGPLLGERVDARRWAGIGVGFVGAALVLFPDVAGRAGVATPVGAVVSCLVAMLSITLGTIWQKRIGGSADLRAGAAIQMIGGLAVTLPVALSTEHGVDNAPQVWFGLAYSVVVLSVLTTLLLLYLITRGAVAEVTALFYMVPAVTALMSLAFFGETLAPVQILGMVVATIGVILARKREAAPR